MNRHRKFRRIEVACPRDKSSPVRAKWCRPNILARAINSPEGKEQLKFHQRYYTPIIYPPPPQGGFDGSRRSIALINRVRIERWIGRPIQGSSIAAQSRNPSPLSQMFNNLPQLGRSGRCTWYRDKPWGEAPCGSAKGCRGWLKGSRRTGYAGRGRKGKRVGLTCIWAIATHGV